MTFSSPWCMCEMLVSGRRCLLVNGSKRGGLPGSKICALFSLQGVTITVI